MAEAFMVYYHPQWIKLQELLAEGAIGQAPPCRALFPISMSIRAICVTAGTGGGALPDIGVYPTVVTRMVTGQEPVSVQASVEYDPAFGTDRYANVSALRRF